MISFVKQLREGARRTPDRVAMVLGGEALSCAELERVTEERAVALRRDVACGDRVLVCVDDALERAAMVLALLKLGAVPVVPAREASLEACVREVRPKFAVVAWSAFARRWWLRSRVERVLIAGEVDFDDAPVPLREGSLIVFSRAARAVTELHDGWRLAR